jgi:hypothetical protein
MVRCWGRYRRGGLQVGSQCGPVCKKTVKTALRACFGAIVPARGYVSMSSVFKASMRLNRGV